MPHGSGITAEPLDQPSLLLPFTTDGCSLFPDGPVWDKNRWRPCCVMHDVAYWQGGDYSDRIQADDNLRRCVVAVGEPLMAVTMLVGVRVGGSPLWFTDFRWGYGWREWRGYKPLTLEEQMLVKLMLKTHQNKF